MRHIRILIAGWMCICTSGLLCADVMSRRTHLDSTTIINDSLVRRDVNPDSIPLQSLTVEARASLNSCKEGIGMSKNHWGVMLASHTDTVNVTLTFGNTDYGDILDRRITVVCVECNGTQLYSQEAEGFRMSSGDFNSLSLNLSADGHLAIYGGGVRTAYISDVTLISGFEPISAAVWSIGPITLSVLSTESVFAPRHMLATAHTRESLDRRFRSTHDRLEGYWQYFDRTNDPAYARPGGRYTLAIIKNDDDTSHMEDGVSSCYDIIYVDGAQTLADQWHPMMLKGRLRSTIFDGHYDLTWIDSTMQTISEDIHATVEDGALLTLNFPLLKTTMRFSKQPLTPITN